MSVKNIELKNDNQHLILEGLVGSINPTNADQFYFDNVVNMTKSGVRSYLRTLGVPQGFFLGLPVDLQKDVLEAQKVIKLGSISELWVALSEDGEFVKYVAPDSLAGYKDPAEVLGLEGPKGWALLEHNWDRGVSDYVNIIGDHSFLINDVDYKLSVMAYVPMFYSKTIYLNLGLFSAETGNIISFKDITGTDVWEIDPEAIKADEIDGFVDKAKNFFDPKKVNSAIHEWDSLYLPTEQVKKHIETLAMNVSVPRGYVSKLNSKLISPDNLCLEKDGTEVEGLLASCFIDTAIDLANRYSSRSVRTRITRAFWELT